MNGGPVHESNAVTASEYHKTWMLERGEWRAMAQENGAKTAGFHLSSLYSPVGWRSWREIAAAWEAAVNKESGSAGLTIRYPTGFVHLPKIDAEFIQQLCAEQLITRRDRNGFPVREWQKMRERNEALDCYVYARAAAAAAGLDRFEERHWRELERQLGVAPPPDEPQPIQDIELNEATQWGGLAASGQRSAGRRVIRSRWLR